MKKLLFIAVAGLFFLANSNAQIQRKIPQHQRMKSDSSLHFQKGQMMQNLNLTDDQKTQLKSMREEMKQQHSAIQNDASLTADQKKEKMKSLRQSQMQKMNAILTPDQQAKMKAFREQRGKNQGMQKGHKMMKDQLGLTTDQKNQMRALHESMQQQRNAIQNDASLSADQKKEKMKELHKAQMGKVNAILTPDQQAKMKAFRQQRMQNRKMHNMQNKMKQPQQS
jgi:Spy/CpxP family protein refolding chaperone